MILATADRPIAFERRDSGRNPDTTATERPSGAVSSPITRVRRKPASEVSEATPASTLRARPRRRRRAGRSGILRWSRRPRRLRARLDLHALDARAQERVAEPPGRQPAAELDSAAGGGQGLEARVGGEAGRGAQARDGVAQEPASRGSITRETNTCRFRASRRRAAAVAARPETPSGAARAPASSRGCASRNPVGVGARRVGVRRRGGLGRGHAERRNKAVPKRLASGAASFGRIRRRALLAAETGGDGTARRGAFEREEGDADAATPADSAGRFSDTIAGPAGGAESPPASARISRERPPRGKPAF